MLCYYVTLHTSFIPVMSQPSCCKILKTQSLNPSEFLWELPSATHLVWAYSEGRFLFGDSGSSHYSSFTQCRSEPWSAWEWPRTLATCWTSECPHLYLFGWHFHENKNPFWFLLFSWTGCLDVISLLADFKSRRTFWQLMRNKFWSDMFRASSHRSVFNFIEKEQIREVWPHDLYLSNTQ